MTRARGLGLTTVGRLLGKIASESVEEFETLFGSASVTDKLSLYAHVAKATREASLYGKLLLDLMGSLHCIPESA